MKERDHSIDILKGIGILLVIVGHCDLFGRVNGLIYSFHMPLFIILSGYFFSYKPVLQVITGGGKILKSYIITAIATCIVFLFYRSYNLLECLEAIVFAHGWPQNTLFFPTKTWIGPTWFLMALFWCRIYYCAFYRICNKNIYITAIVSFSITWLAILLGREYINLPFGVLTGLSFLFFYAIGVLLSRSNSIYKWAPFVVIVWFFYHPPLYLVTFNYPLFPINSIAVIGLCVFMLYLVRWMLKKTRLKDIRILSFLGEQSLTILCVHQIVYHIGVLTGINSISFFIINFTVPIVYCFLKVVIQKNGTDLFNRWKWIHR